MTIQAISFGKMLTTENGNQYKKSNIGKVIGLAGGAAYGAYSLNAAQKMLARKGATAMPAFRTMAQQVAKYVEMGMSRPKAKAVVKKSFSAGMIASTVLMAFLGLAFGAIIDKAINRNRAADADKAQKA